MKEAIVGIRNDGEVRAVFNIDCPRDEREASSAASQWLKEGRTVRRCSQEHAKTVIGKQWKDPA
jgi:hypothetical protein